MGDSTVRVDLLCEIFSLLRGSAAVSVRCVGLHQISAIWRIFIHQMNRMTLWEFIFTLLLGNNFYTNSSMAVQ